MHRSYGVHKDKGDSFFEVPALSFQSQDTLHSLFDLVLDADETFTLVIGAGVSLDAGLPSWGQLISNMVNSSQFDERWRQAALDDSADLMRKAETVLQIIVAKRASTRDQIVRDALYMERGGTDRPITPGRLADSVARLFIMLRRMKKSVGLVTTNFDTVLETAINEYAAFPEIASSDDSFTVTPHVLSDAAGDDGADAAWDPDTSVMHLHGLLAPREAPSGRLVLTESEFLSVGPRVKRFLLGRMRDSVTIFIGVSLTDPNLVGPLWQLKDEGKQGDKTFVLSVCTPQKAMQGDGGLDTAEAYEIKKVEALSTVLPVTPILLKSYGQQMQLLYELAYVLQLQEANRAADYTDNHNPATSERYGHRLTRVLEKAYANIKCAPDDDFPAGDDAKALSDRLFAPLDNYGELSTLLHEARIELRDSHSPQERKIYQDFHHIFEDERFGLFLWLRSRTTAASRTSYSLRLVGTSVYQHRFEWSLDRTAPVRSITRFPVARAGFSGTWALQDDVRKVDWQLWRSMLAVPFSCSIGNLDPGARDGIRSLGDVPAGVISLNSNLYAARTEWERDDQRSILSTMFAPTFVRLTELLQSIAIDAITSAPPPGAAPAGTS